MFSILIILYNDIEIIVSILIETYTEIRMYYTLSDYTELEPKASYVLEEAIVLKIKDLVKELHINLNEPISSVNDRDGENHSKKYNRRNRKMKQPAWDRHPDFKVTKFEDKTGIDKMIDNIRISLNKMSNTNYQTHRDLIVEHIQSIIESSEDDNNENILVIITSFFKVIESNKLMNKLYAKLYGELITKHDLFDQQLHKYVDNYETRFDIIEYANSEEDYNLFCKQNKEKDNRASCTSFIIELVKQELINKNELSKYIHLFKTKIDTNKNIEHQQSRLEELTDNIYLLLTETKEELKELEVFDSIEEWVISMTKLNVKDNVSISSRIKFKYMDIIDAWKKTKS